MGLDLLQFQGAEGQGFFHAAPISDVPLKANDQIHRALAVKMGIGRNLINMIFALGRKGLIGQYRPLEPGGLLHRAIIALFPTRHFLAVHDFKAPPVQHLLVFPAHSP